ncbi:helix-turn-helix transcriptional regulator [Faecalispora jeddahensis]|uniref:helix-turn-helix domain-containing protein n=1 Tax=Faecalispora jeddahensis TaxID=1414721 RepID=UPI0027B914AC|nr:hypothetical protein [Faecalispora jeddahensis]
MRINKEALEMELARACISFADLREYASSATLTKIKNQPNYNATPKLVGKLARALNVPVEAIVEREAAT